MSRERLVTANSASFEEEAFTWSLRPKTIAEYIGQKKVIRKLSISVEAARMRGEPHEHLILHGPPGLGKTTLAHIIAHEMNARLVTTSGPALTRIADLMGILTNLGSNDVLFIDEIQRLPRPVEEFIYPAMEDFKVDFVVDKGPFSKVVNIPVKPFTLIGATTRMGLLSAPLRDRFGMSYHLDFYPPEEILKIIKRSAHILDVKIDETGASIIADRSRGTPRIANRLLRRVRDYALVKSDGCITSTCALESLEMEGIDEKGLDDLDRSFLRVIIEYYQGGPVGIDTIAATLSEDSNTLEELVEPYLLKTGLLMRTKRGRMAGRESYRHMNIDTPDTPQSDIFS